MNNCFIVLNYNDYKTTISLVNKIKNYALIDKIIVVDNYSTDNSYQVLRSLKCNKIDVIRTNLNEGYACGNNFGAYYAIDKYNPKYLFIANPDIEFKEEIIPSIQAVLEEKDNAICTVKLVKSFNYWDIPDFIDVIKSMFLTSKNLCDSKSIKNIGNSEKIEVEVVSGSFFAIKTRVFEEIDGFDERTFLYCEENILASKLKSRNYKTIVLTNEFYEHHHSLTIKKVFSSKIPPFKIYCNSLRVYNKFYLKIKWYHKIIFEGFYFLALLERYVYDYFLKTKSLFSKI